MIPIPRSGRFVSVEGLDQVRDLDHVTGVDITATPGSQVEPPPVGDRYLGFVFARARHRTEVESALRQAMDLVEVVVE
jgi:hypothetical protein